MECPKINNRIRQLVDCYANRSVKKFAESISIPSQTINRLFNIDTRTGKYPVVTTDVLIAIAEMYSVISAEWLLTGRGGMLKPQHTADTNAAVVSPVGKMYPTQDVIATQSVPLYEMPKTATIAALFDGQLKMRDFLYIPDLPHCDGAIMMETNKLSPEIQHGDVLIYKKVKDLKKGLFMGHIYLLAVEIDGEEHIIVKYIQESENKESVKLSDEIKGSGAYDVKFQEIKAAAAIMASLRYRPI